MTDLAPAVTDTSLERLREAREIVEHGTFSQLCDLLLYVDAFATVAREKRAASAAREAARIRIEAIRRVGMLVAAASTDDDRERLLQLVPNRFLRCDEVAAIPQKLFAAAVEDLLARDAACTINSVIRAARVRSLKQVEPEVYHAFDGSIWIIPRGTKRACHVPYGGVDAARRKLGLRKHPHAARIDDAYSMARMLASQLSALGGRLSGESRKLVAEAELRQAEIAELLDQAIKAAVE